MTSREPPIVIAAVTPAIAAALAPAPTISGAAHAANTAMAIRATMRRMDFAPSPPSGTRVRVIMSPG